MYMSYKLWYAAPEGFTYQLMWSWMALPLIKDIILTFIAGIIGHRLYYSVIKKVPFACISMKIFLDKKDWHILKDNLSFS